MCTCVAELMRACVRACVRAWVCIKSMCVHHTSIKRFYFVLTETAELVVRFVIVVVKTLACPFHASDCD